MAEKEQKVEFPSTWSYRIIVEAADKDCPAAILKVLNEYGIKSELEKKDKSSKAKYQAYRVSVVFESQEMMTELSSKLSAVKGVKFLL